MSDGVTAGRRIAAGVMVLVVAGCGDPGTGGTRGYSKAPLERPGLVVRGEQPGEVARYGAPNRVVADRIELPEPAAAAPAAAPPREPVDLPAGVTAEMVAQGEEVYGSIGNCFTCHGAGGTGSPLAPAINDSDWLHIDGSLDALARIIADGVPTPAQYPAAMPPRGGGPLTDEQVRQVAAYVYTISR